MVSFEQEVRLFLKKSKIEFSDGTNTSGVDYKVYGQAVHPIGIEVKEKCNPYNIKNWKTTIPQEFLFILDEVTARKALFSGPYSVVLIRDNTTKLYHVFTLMDLLLVPKERVNRRLYDGTLRGKFLLDLRDTRTEWKFKTLKDAYQFILVSCEEKNETPECLYKGEEIPIRGTVRTFKQFKHDYAITR